MDLAFGAHVREHYYTIGRLAGLETDLNTHAVQSIVVRPDGATDLSAEKRPLAAVPADHFDGDIELRAFASSAAAPSRDRMMMLTGATRLVEKGKQIGLLCGVELDAASGEIVSVVGRHHWWTRQLHLKATELDFSVPGEIRIKERAGREH
jgi:hypothetical protein